MGLAGAAAGANQSLQEMLARAFAEQQAQQQLALRQQEMEQRAKADQQDRDLRVRDFEADQAYRTGQTERQGRLDDVAATDRRQTENQRGVRRMIGDFLIQRGQTPLDAGARNQLQGMAVSEDVDLPEQVLEDPAAEDARKLKLYEEQQKIGARYRPPTAASRNQDWVIRNGVATPIPAGTAQPGDRPYDPVSARTNAPNTEEAASVTRTALDLVNRLETHPGIGAATGAYELRGFTQPAVDFNAIRDQLVAALALPNLGALKGPMSDKDILFVKQLATRLSNSRLSEPETRKAIAEAKTFLGSKMGPTSILPPAGDLEWDPVTKTLKPVQAQP